MGAIWHLFDGFWGIFKRSWGCAAGDCGDGAWGSVFGSLVYELGEHMVGRPLIFELWVVAWGISVCRL